MIDEDIARTGGRILMLMAAIGLGLAVSAIVTAEWIGTTIVPNLGPAESEVVTAYTPLAFIIIAALTAPVVAGIAGYLEGLRSSTNKQAAVVGVACLAGAIVLVMIAGAGVAVADPTADVVDDDDDDDVDEPADDTDDADPGDVDDPEPGVLDLLALSGMVGAGGLVIGGIAVKVGGS